jgi:hypothetical protein
VALLAATQQGLVTRVQLRGCGLTDRQIAVRAATGRLFRAFDGVYAVGVRARAPLARAKAATLAVERSVLGDGSAAWLLGFNRSAPLRPHVVVRRAGGRVREGIVVHRAQALDPRDVTEVEGIPVLTGPRCLLDRAAVLSPRRLDGELRTARAKGLAADDRLRDVIARHPGRPGGPALARALLGPFTRSQLERRFLALVAGLPAPRVNTDVGGMEVDVLWPGLAVELDGRATHGVTARFARDAAKDERLRALGLTVLRLTWWDVVRDEERTLAAVRAALADTMWTVEG